MNSSENATIPTIVIFQGQSQYDVLRYFAIYMSEALEQYGYNTVVIDLLQDDWGSKLLAVIRQGNVFFALGFNGVGLGIEIEGVSIFDKFDIPLFAFFVDHPMYHLGRIHQKAKNIIYSFVDKEHLRFFDLYIKKKNTKSFIPHGTTTQTNCEPLSIKERTIDVFIPGSYTDPDEIRNRWVNQAPFIAQLFDEFAECAISHVDMPVVESAKMVLSEKGLDYNQGAFEKSLPQLLENVDLFVRNYNRRKILKSLKDCKVTICGNGWGTFENQKNLKIYPALPYESILKKCANLKWF